MDLVDARIAEPRCPASIADGNADVVESGAALIVLFGDGAGRLGAARLLAARPGLGLLVSDLRR